MFPIKNFNFINVISIINSIKVLISEPCKIYKFN